MFYSGLFSCLELCSILIEISCFSILKQISKKKKKIYHSDFIQCIITKATEKSQQMLGNTSPSRHQRLSRTLCTFSLWPMPEDRKEGEQIQPLVNGKKWANLAQRAKSLNWRKGAKVTERICQDL